MYHRRHRTIVLSLAAGLGALALAFSLAPAQDSPISADQFAELHRLIKPQPGESPWAKIPWQTNLAAARQKAVAEDKPLFVWRAGGGEVLGRV